MVPRWRQIRTNTTNAGKIDTFMFETRAICNRTRLAMDTDCLQKDYHKCWDGPQKHFTG